jgi:predicted nucleotidyltransferase
VASGNGFSDDLLMAMKRVARVLSDSGVRFALAGGMAVYARGGHVSDHDVDFIIRERDVDGVLEALERAGLRTERPPEDWLVKAYDGDILVDLIHRPVERPVTDETLADTDVLAIGAIAVPVLSATELMVHRLLTFTEHECNFAGAIALARSIREQIDWDRVRDETKESPFAQAFLLLLGSLDLVPAPTPRRGR